jgi:hypothetical protein
MPVRGLRAILLLFFTAGGFASCSLDVSFDGRYSCDPPDGDCPPGYTCGADGLCASGTPIIIDAAVPDAPIDAIGEVTATFGERPGSEVQGVTVDTMLRSDDPTGNFGVNNEFFCDTTPLITGLIRFDLSAIPAGATIRSASLELWTGTDPLQEGTIQLFPVNEAWTEGGFASGEDGVANFNQRVSGTPWSAAGALPPSSASAFVAELSTPLELTAYRFELPASLIQSWVDAPASNFGLACRVSPGVDSDADFKSRNSSQSDHRPELTITYVP